MARTIILSCALNENAGEIGEKVFLDAEAESHSTLLNI